MQPKINNEVMESIRLNQVEKKAGKIEQKAGKISSEEELIATLDEWREGVKGRETDEPTNHESPYVVASEIPTAEFAMTSRQSSGYDVMKYFDEIFLRGRPNDVSGENIIFHDDVRDKRDVTQDASSSRVAMTTYVESFGSEENKHLLPTSGEAYIGEDVLR